MILDLCYHILKNRALPTLTNWLEQLKIRVSKIGRIYIMPRPIYAEHTVSLTREVEK